MWPSNQPDTDIRAEEYRDKIVAMAINKDKVKDCTDYIVENFRVGKLKDLTLIQLKQLLEALENDLV